MADDKSYIDDIKLSPFLSEKSKTTYVNMMKRMIKLSKPPSIDHLLRNADTYAPILEKNASTDEVFRTFMVTILAFFKYSEVKDTDRQSYLRWYTYFIKARKRIYKRIIHHEPTARQKEAHVPWETVMKKYNAMTPGTKQHVLLSLITLIPPRRQTDWFKVRLYNDTNPDFKPKRDHNYINLNYRDPYIMLVEYKTAKYFGEWYKKIPPQLLSILKQSIKDHPREWLFVNGNTGEPYENVDAFAKWSNRTIKTVMGNQKTTMNTMRHSYISYVRENHISKMTLADQLTMSKDMGHNIVQNMGYKLNNHE